VGDQYTWWVGAISANGTIAWDSALSFTIAPVGKGPSGIIATNVPIFNWTGVAGMTSYEVWLTDTSIGQTVTPTVAGMSWTPSQPLNLGDQYTWWVGAINGNGTIAWDSALSFRVAPVGSGPSGVIGTNVPTFSWTSLAGVSSYEIWLTDTTTGQTVTLTVTGASWTPTRLLNLGDQYMWWVGAIGSKEIVWDNSLSFTIAPTASGPSGTISTPMPTFSWTSVVGAISYEIWLTDTNTGQTVTPTVTGTSWTPTQTLNVGGQYKWWVGAISAAGTIAWDKPLLFLISM
jgi:hypothetical protein